MFENVISDIKTLVAFVETPTAAGVPAAADAAASVIKDGLALFQSLFGKKSAQHMDLASACACCKAHIAECESGKKGVSATPPAWLQSVLTILAQVLAILGINTTPSPTPAPVAA